MRRSTGRLGRLLVAALAVGCGGSPAPTATPIAQQPRATAAPATTPAPVTTTEPTAEPSIPAVSTAPEPTPAATTGPITADSIVRVIEGPLRVRSKPSTADDSRKLEPLLETGRLLFVIDGPERGSRYDWYLVNPISGPDRDFGWGGVNDLGWVAAADHDGTAWLELVAVSCPEEPALDDLAGMGLDRLSCYGDRDFEFTETIRLGPRCGDPSFLSGPALLASCQSVFHWGETGSVEVAIPPALTEADGPIGEEDAIDATIVAHMDDPAARTCEGGFYEPSEFDPFILELWCRTTFVATSFKRLSP